MKYGFIGFGNLAQAIYAGLKDNKEVNFAYFDKFSKESEAQFLSSLDKLISFSDVIWLCVKPQNVVEILEQLKSFDLKDKVIVSPVGGKSISFLEEFLGKDVSIIRIMPNLAVSYKKSVTAYCINDKKNSLTEIVKNDLGKLGKAVELSEEKFDLFTPIFGSGPAFILEFLKVFKNRMVNLEIPEDQSNGLLVELLLGTAAYFDKNKTEKSISELIQNVASKGGITEAGLNYFRNNKLDESIEGVLIAAEKKSQEM